MDNFAFQNKIENMKRNILSVVVGLAIAIITFLIVETINASFHPTPTNLDLQDSIAVKTFYENQPPTFWVMVLTGWIIGSLLCGLLIKIISKNENRKLPIIAGIILTLTRPEIRLHNFKHYV